MILTWTQFPSLFLQTCGDPPSPLQVSWSCTPPMHIQESSSWSKGSGDEMCLIPPDMTTCPIHADRFNDVQGSRKWQEILSDLPLVGQIDFRRIGKIRQTMPRKKPLFSYLEA